MKVDGLKKNSMNAIQAFDVKQEEFVNWLTEGVQNCYLRREAQPSGKLQVKVDLNKEEVGIFRRMQVVSSVINANEEISVESARMRNFNQNIGEEVLLEVTTSELKEVLKAVLNLIEEATIQRFVEKQSETAAEWFSSHKRDAVSGTLLKPLGSFWSIGLEDGVEGVLPVSECLAKDDLKPGQQILLGLKELKDQNGMKQIILSRKEDCILTETIKACVQAVREGDVSVKRVHRDAGRRSKVAVWSNSDKANAVEICVGRAGVVAQQISDRLGGERVEFVEYYNEDKDFIASALGRVKIKDVVLNQARKEAEVHVFKGEEGKAIGEDGSNVRQAEALTGWKISVKSTGEDYVY